MILLAAALASVTPVPPDAGEAAWAPRRVAVVIGVQTYQDPALQGLRFPDKDARDLADALRDPAAGAFDRVFEIHGPAATARAALLNAVKVAAADLRRDDTFLLYASGHGTLTLDPLEGSRLWFLPSDGQLDHPERTGIAVAELEDLLNGLPARRRVLVLDTCHNGRAKSGLGESTAQLLQGLRGEVPTPRGEREVAESEARLYAAQYYQPAMEDPELQNGVYTHFLVQALRQPALADLDRDGLVDVAEAHEHARDRTIAYTGGLQVPRAEYRIVGREDIYLSGPSSVRQSAERALVAAYDAVLARARLLVNGTPRGELPGLYAVEPGPAVVEVRTPDDRLVVRQRLHLAAGETLGVEALLARRRGYLEVLGGVEVAPGPSLEGGTGFHALAGGLELGWVRPWSPAGPWRPDLRVGATLGTGPLASTAGAETSTGAVSLRGTWAWSPGAPYLGPTLALRVPYRVEAATGRAEWNVSPTAGAAVGLALPVAGDLWLDVRAEGWGGALPWDGAVVPWWGAGVQAGFGFGG